MCQVLQSVGDEELELKRTIEKISHYVQYHSGSHSILHLPKPIKEFLRELQALVSKVHILAPFF